MNSNPMPDLQTQAPENTAAVRWTLATLSLSMLLSSLGTSIANVALPTLAQAFDASFQQVQWIVLAYLLAITTLIVSVGRIGDLWGRRRLLLAGIALFAAASILCGMAPTLGLLIAARALQGLGAAVMMALAMTLVGDTVPKTRTGRAMDLLGTMSAVGTALGPTLGGVLISTVGWHAIFLVNAPLGILGYVLAHRHLPADRPRSRDASGGFDRTGTLLLALALAAYALAMTTGPGFGALSLGLLIIATAGAGLFVLHQSRSPSPLVRLALLRDPVLGAGLASSLLVATVVMATLVVGPFYLSGAHGLDAATVGLVLSIGPVVVSLGGVPAGKLTDRFGAQRVVIAGLAALAAGSLLLWTLPASLGLAGYIPAIVTLTLGYALFQTANNTAIMADVLQDRRGVISGLLSLSRNLGLITGASAMGAVFAFASARAGTATSSAEAIAAGMHATFTVAAALIVIALGVTVTSHVRAARASTATQQC